MPRRPGRATWAWATLIAVAIVVAVGLVASRAGSDGAGEGAQAAALPQPPDSRAPAGAPPHWIPSDEWVMQHWLPFDEGRLLRLLDIERETLWRHLRDDRRTIAQLAARRGWPDPRALARKLIAPRRARVGADKARELESRAEQTLTQGHLAQHLLFHSLHQDAVPDQARRIFGVPNTDRFQRLRRLDISPLQIARMNGRSGAQVRVEAEEALRERATAGARAGELSSSQARLLVARQLRQLPRWLSESHYNGPPRTNRTGRLSEPPTPAWAAPAITADGRAVVMEAYEPKLPLALARGEISVVAWRSERGARALSHAGAEPAGLPFSAYNPAVSSDGRKVAFETSAGNRNFAKRYGDTRVLLSDEATGRTRVMSDTPPGVDRTAYAPTVSGDGRVVAFQAVDVDRAAPARSLPTRVLVREAAGRRAQAIPRPPVIAGVRPGREAHEPALSRSGRLVAFSAPTRDPDGPGSAVYVHDRRTSRTVLVSRATGHAGRAADAESWGPRLSADGRFVAFSSTATNLSGGAPGRGEAGIYLRDLRQGTTRLVSRTSHGRPLRGFASEAAIAADGSTIAFSLAPARALDAKGRGRPVQRVYRRDLRSARTHAVSPARGYAGQPSVSASGAQVAFTADEGGPTLRVRIADAARSGSTVLAAPSSFPTRAATTESAATRRHLCRLRPPAW